MAHKRAVAPAYELHGGELTAAMVGIGMNFAVEPMADANIEDTLLFASIAGMLQDDLRVLAVLVTWFGVHSPWVNADRLVRLVAMQSSTRVRAFWSALAAWKTTDRRLARLARLHDGDPVDVLAVGTEFQIARHGEDPRFSGSSVRVPSNTLRDRPSDVLTPTELAERHAAYRWRVIIGPTYRADMWAAAEADPSVCAAQLARQAYGSFATAWRVKQDFAVVRPRPGNPSAAPESSGHGTGTSDADRSR